MKGLFGPQGTDCKEVQGGFRNGQQRWDRYSGGRVLTCIQSLIMSPLSRTVMKRVCYVRNQSDMQRFSDSDTETQMI